MPIFSFFGIGQDWAPPCSCRTEWRKAKRGEGVLACYNPILWPFGAYAAYPFRTAGRMEYGAKRKGSDPYGRRRRRRRRRVLCSSAASSPASLALLVRRGRNGVRHGSERSPCASRKPQAASEGGEYGGGRRGEGTYDPIRTAGPRAI